MAATIPPELMSSSTIKSFRDAPRPPLLKTVQDTKYGFDKRKKALVDKYKPKPVPEDEYVKLGFDTFRKVPASLVGKPENLLHRLDNRPTATIFAQGFQPWNLDPGSTDPRAYDLYAHIITSKNNTLFVSTYQPGGVLPFNPNGGFRYDIYAYGGIDLRLALAEDYDFPQQLEITFPGGVLPKFIKGATPYTVKDDKPVFGTYITNAGFSP